MPEPARRLYPVDGSLARAIAPDVVVDHERERERELTLSSSPPLHHRPRRLRRYSERCLARWMQERLNFLGADVAVRKHGARRVLDALYSGVVCEEWAIVERLVAGRIVHTERRRLVASSQLRSPGAFLRWLLDQDVRS